MGVANPLKFTIEGKCTESKARAGKMILPHSVVDTPAFMPVGTQGTLKSLLPEQVENIGYDLILANTYHLGNRPGPDLLKKVSGLHNFMKWKKSLLTDSGGFQMVSLLKLSEVTEEGVRFESPHDKTIMLLTPEKSIEIQNAIGADIAMQLDDVVHSSTRGSRLEEAERRTVRWLDRCLEAHQRPHDQNIFPIVQGGLNAELRKRNVEELSKREVNGFAVGGLSGGEEKTDFWKMVSISTNGLPELKPRYLMGVGFAVDMVVCVALGCDMFDCVFPTRTARFGSALVASGQMNLRRSEYSRDFIPIDPDCKCSTCETYTRAYLHIIVTRLPVACSLLTVHNLTYQKRLMNDIKDSILHGRFPEFVKDFMKRAFPVIAEPRYPEWVTEALAHVNIILSKDE